MAFLLVMFMSVNTTNKNRLAIDQQLTIFYLYCSKADIISLTINDFAVFINKRYNKAVEVRGFSRPLFGSCYIKVLEHHIIPPAFFINTFIVGTSDDLFSHSLLCIKQLNTHFVCGWCFNSGAHRHFAIAITSIQRRCYKDILNMIARFGNQVHIAKYAA